MKSIFLVTLLCALLSEVATAQAPKRKRRAINPPTNPRATQKTILPIDKKPEVRKDSFDKFYERLTIAYFGVYLSSPLAYLHSDYAATSPDFETPSSGCPDNCDTYAQNIFNQITFSYHFGGGSKFIIVPRWTLFLGNANKTNLPGTYDGSQLIEVEDPLVGWSFNLLTSVDKRWAWNIRPAVRLPVSRGSRGGDAARFGDVTFQPDIATSIAYTMSPSWSFGYSLQNRFWVYEDRFNESRHRIAQSLNANQALSEDLSLSYNLEYWVQNDRNRESLNQAAASYKRNWFNTYVGLSWAATKKLNVTPILGVFPGDPDFGLNSAYASAWIAYLIK